MSTAHSFGEHFDLVRFERCAVSVRARCRTSVPEEDALMILERSFKLTGHRQYVVLVAVDDIMAVSSAARHALSSSRNVLAAAMLGQSTMDQMLAAPYLHAVFPGEYFTD
jgi:hypothetical protein